MPENPPRPVEYLGVAGVAAWFGVQPETVTAWLNRYPGQAADDGGDPDGWPEPDSYIRSADRADNRSIDRGWLPSREAEWRAWEARRPGRGAPGKARPDVAARHAARRSST